MNKGLVILLLVIVLAVLLAALWYSLKSPLAMYPDAAKEALARAEFDHVVDVRTEAEWNLGHYPLAIHIPITTLKEALPQRIPDKKARILFYCNTSTRARQAAEAAQAIGYPNVRYLIGTHVNLLKKTQ
jgi:phage shock protein E